MFNSKDEMPSVLTGKTIVEKGSPDFADVEVSGRAESKTHPHGFTHLGLFFLFE